MTDRKPAIYLCSYCRQGVVKSLPATCPNPDCRAELTLPVSAPKPIAELQRETAKKPAEG